VGQVGGFESVFAVETIGQAANNLGKDNPAIAPRPHKGAIGQAFTDMLGGIFRFSAGFQFFDGGFHSPAHVRAGIPIRHGEDIEGIDSLGVLLQPAGAGEKGLAQISAGTGAINSGGIV